MDREQSEAFDDFVAARRAAVLRTAVLLTGDRGRAEDLVQTAFFETYRRWRRLDDQRDPVAYVRKVLVTTHLSWLRRRSSSEAVVSELPDTGHAGHADGVVERDRMRTALATLPPRVRTTLVLRFYEDLSEAETARLMGCSVGTVKSQTARGLGRLRDHLQDTPAPDGASRQETH
ncbi:SigE family RNA polymerase sigma factor [Modestobacter sp. I12A-02628]|uniref:SigE family RNA polymerase sigma factor n=1 Tax=Goekera deserti TaxID=2497753 RepID=A0A7K3WIS1_9ACTN|nr:SigE family RNA polymerase sigma factor [Goekera deserti]MPQ96677.1 SigE family RNA polymerase sigma factor [Goekera deserti]NDI47009.1 SigE family RNA polymerase sigma factor [Goekera deserti]NEL56246.1 SigE family RNA polymerase sigma factor [Goekera deserti]